MGKTTRVFGDREQVRDWLDLNDAIDNVAGGDVPCRQAPDLFFPEYGDGTAVVHATMAKNACKSCEVINQCGAYAIKYREDFGIWGGMTYNDRKAIWGKK